MMNMFLNQKRSNDDVAADNDCERVISNCIECPDTGRPPDTGIVTCDYFNSPLNVSHPIPPQSLDAGQAMRPEYDSWA